MMVDVATSVGLLVTFRLPVRSAMHHTSRIGIDDPRPSVTNSRSMHTCTFHSACSEPHIVTCARKYHTHCDVDHPVLIRHDTAANHVIISNHQGFGKSVVHAEDIVDQAGCGRNQKYPCLGSEAGGRCEVSRTQTPPLLLSHCQPDHTST